MSLLVSLAAACKHAPAEEKAPLKVAAAADLAFAFKEVGAAFTQRDGVEVTFSFGSTGLLARQIAEGAPFDVFAAANVSYVDGVVRVGRCRGDTQALYARGRIVMWWKKDSPTRPPRDLADLADARFIKVAIANPEHAPYGRAAREALVHASVWERIQGRLVFGENVQQTLQFARSGNAEVAIVALSLATAAEDGAFVPIDTAMHQALDQALVVCGEGQGAEGGRRFAAFVNSAEGRAILRRHGFLLPGESLATRAH